MIAPVITPVIAPGLSTFADPGADLQTPMDAAVVIPTVLRPSLHQALLSVFAQAAGGLGGRVHVLVGVDVAGRGLELVESACLQRPAGWVVQVLWPGYSTSVRHGGLGRARDGGVLRGVLTHLANSRWVAYLDDDNWWDPSHLATLKAALVQTGSDWAFSLRWFVHPATSRPVCVDGWESVGPGRGIFVERFGGFVDTNCLLVDKLACPAVPLLWTEPLGEDPKGMSADRRVFENLCRHKGACTGQPTVFYRVDPGDELHEGRVRQMGEAWALAGSPVS